MDNRLCKPPRLAFAAQFPKNPSQFFAHSTHSPSPPPSAPAASSIRMSSGPSCWKLNPRSGRSSCAELMPRSSSMPSQPAAGTHPPIPQNFRAEFQTVRQTFPPAAFSPLQSRRHRDRTHTAIQSANSRPRWLPRVQPHRASRRRNVRPASALTRPAPPPPSLVCERNPALRIVFPLVNPRLRETSVPPGIPRAGSAAAKPAPPLRPPYAI